MRSWSCNLMTYIWTVMAALSMAAEGPRVFKVGDGFGWRVPVPNDTAVYSNWASSNRFHIGDSLLFVYEKDSVMEVDKWGFYHCNRSDPITAFDNGNSTLKLDRPGLFYFISGAMGHCSSGQRLIVEVMHMHHRHASLPPALVDYPYSSIAPSTSPLSAPASVSASGASSSSVSRCGLLVSLLPAFAAFSLAVLWREP